MSSGLDMKTLSGLLMLTVLPMQVVGLVSTTELLDSSITSNVPNYTVTCEDICDSVHCFYPLYEEMLPDPKHRDCEATLYRQDDVVMGHSSLSGKPTNLSTEYCTDQLLLKITCIDPYYRYKARYTVVPTSDSTSSGHLCMLLLLLCQVFMIVCCL